MKKVNSKSKNTLENKIINLQLMNNIQNSKLYIRHLDVKINFYQKQLELIENKKPFIFQKKINDYYKEIEHYKRQIKITYQQLQEEVDNISKIQANLKD